VEDKYQSFYDRDGFIAKSESESLG